MVATVSSKYTSGADVGGEKPPTMNYTALQFSMKYISRFSPLCQILLARAC